MPCEHYKDTLIEAAASGAAPSGELRAHLDSCASCRAAFDEEQSVFAAIDFALRTAINAEVPVTLLPGVRVRLDQAALPTRSGFANWYAFAGAAAMVLILFASRAIWHGSSPEGPLPTVISSNAPDASTLKPLPWSAAAPLAAVESRRPIRRLTHDANTGSLDAFPGSNSTPEVLVSRDQEVLLVQYAERWRSLKQTPLLAQDSSADALAPLKVSEIQIAELDVMPLADDKSR